MTGDIQILSRAAEQFPGYKLSAYSIPEMK